MKSFLRYSLIAVIFAGMSVRESIAQSPSSYAEPMKTSVKKNFRSIRTVGQKQDTAVFQWISFGRVDSLFDGTILYGYQQLVGKAKLNAYFAADDSGIVYYPGITQTEDSDAANELHAPLTAGSAWIYRLGDTARLRISAIGETVAVPAGTYKNCVVVETAPGVQKIYAPDIGLIKIHEQSDNYSAVTELVSAGQ